MAGNCFGARQVVRWRAKSLFGVRQQGESARAKWEVGTPTYHLARANSGLGARQLRSWRAPSGELTRANC